MTEDAVPENWREIRAKGLHHFIFSRGVLIYGVSLALIFTLGKFAYLFFARDFSFSFVDAKFTGETFAYVLFWLFVGGVLAWRQWLRIEKAFLSENS